MTAPLGTEYTYSIDGTNFQSSPVFNNVGAGNYTITAISSVAGSCQATGTVEINGPANAPVVTATSADPTCADPEAGTITVTAPLGTEYTYSIDGTNFQSSPVFNNVGAGNYTITAISSVAGSCQATGTVEINGPANAPVVTATSADPTCADPEAGTITVTAPLGTEYTYSIDGTNFQSSPVFNNVGAGNYTITLRSTAVGSCEGTTTVTINAPNGDECCPTGVVVTPTNASCNQTDGSLTIGTVTGGAAPFTYSVDGGAYTDNTSYTNLSVGQHTIDVKDANDCIFSTTVTIIAESGPTAAEINSVNPACNQTNGSINIGPVTGGTAPYEYSIDGVNYSGTTDFTDLAAGPYTVTIRDVNGCVYSTTITLTSGTGPTGAAITSTNPACNQTNGSINIGPVEGGTGPYEYAIDGGAYSGTADFNNLPAGPHVINIRDANGCVYSTTITLTSGTGPTGAAITSTNPAVTKRMVLLISDLLKVALVLMNMQLMVVVIATLQTSTTWLLVHTSSISVM